MWVSSRERCDVKSGKCRWSSHIWNWTVYLTFNVTPVWSLGWKVYKEKERNPHQVSQSTVWKTQVTDGTRGCYSKHSYDPTRLSVWFLYGLTHLSVPRREKTRPRGKGFSPKKKKYLTSWFLYSMTETLYLQEGSISLPNKPDFIQEADTFSLGSNKVMSETIGVLSCLKINMCLSVLLY